MIPILEMISKGIIDGFRSIADDSRSIPDDSRSIIDDSKLVLKLMATLQLSYFYSRGHWLIDIQ